MKKSILIVLGLIMITFLVACGSNEGTVTDNKNDIENIAEDIVSDDVRTEDELNRVKVCEQGNAGIKRSGEAAYYYVPIHPLNDIPSMNVTRNNIDDENSRYYITQTSSSDVMNLQKLIYVVEPYYSIDNNPVPETLEDTAKVLSESAFKELNNFINASELHLSYKDKVTINGYDTLKFTGTFTNTLQTGTYEGYLAGYCFIYDGVPYGIVSIINTGWKYPNINDDTIKEVNDLVDGCIKTVQVLDSYTGMAKEKNKPEGVFYNIKSLIQKNSKYDEV